MVSCYKNFWNHIFVVFFFWFFYNSVNSAKKFQHFEVFFLIIFLLGFYLTKIFHFLWNKQLQNWSLTVGTFSLLGGVGWILLESLIFGHWFWAAFETFNKCLFEFCFIFMLFKNLKVHSSQKFRNIRKRRFYSKV